VRLVSEGQHRRSKGFDSFWEGKPCICRASGRKVMCRHRSFGQALFDTICILSFKGPYLDPQPDTP
jgi:hypothetical protein